MQCATHTLDAGSNKNIKEIEILLKRNWKKYLKFGFNIFLNNVENILNDNNLNMLSISFLILKSTF